MKFKDLISTLPESQDFPVEIKLNSWESITIENIEWKQASLRLLQSHLWWKEETNEEFPLETFCEYYEEWKGNPEGHHTTIAFLDKYNKQGGKITKK